MSKDRAGDALFGEDYFAVHRNGSAPVSHPSERFAVPLWCAVLRYWVGVLIVCVVGWNRASGHAGAGGRWLLPVLAMVGGIAALTIAWLSKLRTPDRRLLYSAWSASAIVAAFVAWLLRFRSDVAIPVVAGAMFAAYPTTRPVGVPAADALASGSRRLPRGVGGEADARARWQNGLVARALSASGMVHGPNPGEEHPDLEFPLLQIRPQQRRLLLVGELNPRKRLRLIG